MTNLFSSRRTMMLFLSILSILFLTIWCGVSFAADKGLPWESGLKMIKESLSGPVALGIAVIGVVGCGLGLAFGGEISGFMKTVVILVLVVCLAVCANAFVSKVTGEDSSATIPDFELSVPVSSENNNLNKI